MANAIKAMKEKIYRHKERHTSLGYKTIVSESIDFLRPDHWDTIAGQNSIFLSRAYLKAIETFSPDNTSQRYGIAYSNDKPMVIIVCQIAELSGERLVKIDNKIANALSKKYRERVLVCGNLVSSGLHGIAFNDDLDPEEGWKIVGEILNKIRHNENLSGKIDFSLIKDIKGDILKSSEAIERYSFRKIQTDPDMVLELPMDINSFDDYLKLLTSKYRSRVKKVIKSIDQSQYTCKEIELNQSIDKTIHALYLNVENKSNTRLATLVPGYFHKLSTNLKENFICKGIFDGDKILGFISIIIDNKVALAYYVGFDYEINEKNPIYFRLLQLVIETAIEKNCNKVSFGRSALEPKANLGAKPVEAFIWARHNISSVNVVLRNFFRNIPFDDAPERSVLKD